jgi:hypothetical protein
VSEVFDRDRIHRKLTEMSSFWRHRIDGWRDEGTESGTEKRHAQQLWSDLMQCFDIASERIDVFERNADRASTGGRGYIDFFWSGVVIGEAKSLNVPLDLAYDQVLDYLNGGSVGTHEWPRFILVTNFEGFRLDRLGHVDESWTVEFTIDEIADHLEQLLFFVGVETLTKREQENASIEAARLMANLFTTLVGNEADEAVGEDAPIDPEDEDDTTELASILMTRLLFLMYGDDAGLWEQDLFYRWVESVNSKNIGPALDGLFQVLNTDEATRRRKFRNSLPDLEARFPYVNGGIFDGTAQVGYSVPPEFKDALLDASRFRWTSISPAIFGSMFQLVKSQEARRGDGEHYTSETNILKTVGPLFLDDYRQRADRLIANKSTSVADLRRFQEELAANVYIDPACGAGNFLNVAYAKLREIETDIIVERRKRSGTGTGSLDVSFDQLLTIDKFYGIELNWWPAKIAETAMFLVDHQANRQLAAKIGEAPDRLPIRITATIIHADALEIDWNEAFPTTTGQTFVFGNPPFLGHDSRTTEQAAQLRAVWKRKDISRLDYVTAWHVKALELLEKRDGQWAFVTTNSITQGDQVPRLFGKIYSHDWKVKFAHRTFEWDSEAPGKAAVHCVIVGFTRGDILTPRLWDYEHVRGEAQEIPVRVGVNAYLVDGPDVLVQSRSKPLNPQLPPAAFGNVPRDGGGLIITPTEYPQFMADPIAAKYVRPYIGARELLNAKERWCLWLVDLDPSDVERSSLLKERINKVRDFRLNSSSKDAREAAMTPHLFWWNSHPNVDYLCIPRVVSENRPFFIADRLDETVIASDATCVAPDPDGLLFAMVSSSMFITWQRAVGGRLKSDLRFSGTLSWNNFPLPEVSPEQKEAIITAGTEIVEVRASRPDRSLAQQYAPLAMDPTLLKAHNRLDALVDRAFGASRRLSNERQRLELLFESYQALTCEG